MCVCAIALLVLQGRISFNNFFCNFLSGLLSVCKLGTGGQCTNEFSQLNMGIPALRRKVNETVTVGNHKELIKHPLLSEAMSYWQDALDVVVCAHDNAKTSVIKYRIEDLLV